MDAQEKEFIQDVMTTAVEGGIYYWSSLRAIERDDDFTVTAFDVRPCEPSFSDGRTDPRDRWRRVTAEAALSAANVIAANPALCPGCASIIAQGIKERDASHIDADCADAILQVALFGEVVFG